MEYVITRREALKRLSIAAGTLLAVDATHAAPPSRPAAAAGPAAARGAVPHLAPRDPEAEAISYHENAATVNPKEFPEFRPGQKCANCSQLVGKDGEKWRPCVLVPGTLVSTEGWCQAYAKKT